MSAPYSRKGNLLFVGMLLLVSVLVEQYAIVPFFPWIGELGGFRPMLVFLDIPLPLPKIDWLPVSILFAIGYAIAVAPDLSRNGQRGTLNKKVWKALTGWWLLILLLLAGGVIYSYVQDYLPKQVDNGIDSFGLRADVTLPWPYDNLIHLHGSMLLLIFFLIGALILSHRTALPAAASTPVVVSAHFPASAPVTASIPAAEPILMPDPPPTCRYTTPPPVAIIMPRPAVRRMHPCVVAGVVEPAKSRRATTAVLEPAGA